MPGKGGSPGLPSHQSQVTSVNFRDSYGLLLPIEGGAAGRECQGRRVITTLIGKASLSDLGLFMWLLKYSQQIQILMSIYVPDDTTSFVRYH